MSMLIKSLPYSRHQPKAGDWDFSGGELALHVRGPGFNPSTEKRKKETIKSSREGGMAQWIKCLLSKLGDLSSNSQSPKIQAWLCLPVTLALVV